MPQDIAPRVHPHTFVKGVHGIRYQVKDVARSVAVLHPASRFHA